jgi:hypothetical protein
MNVTRASASRRQIAHASKMQLGEWVGLLILLCIIGIILVSAFSDFSSVLLSHVSSESVLAGVNQREGALLVETDPGHCRQYSFDNDSGKIVPSTASCEQQSRNGESVAGPTGTIHRLDAISKSFFGR